MLPITDKDNTHTSATQDAVKILYTNYRGEKSWRKVRPMKIWFGETEWHPGKQWLLDAIDIDKDAKRSFAIQDIEAWQPESG